MYEISNKDEFTFLYIFSIKYEKTLEYFFAILE